MIEEIGGLLERGLSMKRFERVFAMFTGFHLNDSLMRVHRRNRSTQILTRNRDDISGLQHRMRFFRWHRSARPHAFSVQAFRNP